MGWFKRKEKEPVRNPRIEADESLTFRRSRTLTGSSSQDIRVAGEGRAQIKSPRLREHELRTHRRKLSFYLAIVAACCAGILALMSQFNGIITLAVQSQSPLMKPIDEARYASVINDYFMERPQERFRFAFNKTALASYLEAKAPEVATVTIEGTGIATATASIAFREPVVAWQQKGVRAYVDGDGHLFRENYYNEPSVTVKDDSGLDTAGADSGLVISDRFLQFMGRVISLTNESGVARVTGATLPRGYAREIDFNLEGRGYIVKTQLGRDPASQATDIINAVKYIESKQLKPQYVDVRVAGKAAYK